MPEIKQMPFVGPAYESISKPFAAQQCINLYLENSQAAARSQQALIGTPGFRLFVDLGPEPTRGSHVFQGSMYAVSGTDAFKIESDGTTQLLGTIPGTDQVSIENNVTQVCFVNGVEGFIYTPSSDTFEEIIDPDFRPAQIVQFLDQYFLFNEPGTNNFFISAFGNGLAYNGLDVGVAEGSPDNIVSILSDHRDLLLFGETTIELWNNTGNPDFPFEVQNGVFIERGCAAAFSVEKLDNQVYWLGDDRAVYTLEGYLPAKKSTYAIDEQIRQYDRVDDAVALTYTEGGHFFYAISFPSGNETFVYDASTQQWHQRSSGLLGARWRADSYVRFGDKNIVGDSLSGKLFEMDLETYDELGEEMPAIRTTMPETANELPVFMSKLQVVIESGIGLLTGQGSDPIAALEWSDDGGHTFKDPRFRSMGKIGEYRRRVIWRRLGRFRNRVFRFTITDPVKRVIIDASAEWEPGL